MKFRIHFVVVICKNVYYRLDFVVKEKFQFFVAISLA